MAQLRLRSSRTVPKPHPIRAPLNPEDIDFNFDLLYKVLSSVKGILDAVLPVPRGGTGLASYLKGDLLVATDTSVLGTLNAVATGSVLISRGALERIVS